MPTAGKVGETFGISGYLVAKKHFEVALERVKRNKKTMIQSKWEPLLNNLGHVYRKLQIYDKAIEYHMQAMVLSPNNASTYSAIGYCQVLKGQCKKAAELFHKALALKRDDTFSTNMLNYVLELLVDEYQEPVKPDNEFSIEKPFLGREIFYCDANGSKPKSPALPALIPLDDISCEDAFKSRNCTAEDQNDSSKLSFEVEMSGSCSMSLDGTSVKI